LDARQFALKMTSNVTYGYCSASYSGRMPNSGIADAIVSLGRQALIRATDTLHDASNHALKWVPKTEALRALERSQGRAVGTLPVRCENVYGDTDALFVKLHHVVNRNVAHDLGVYIAEEMSKENPPPVKMKYEKCYLPCILQTKKRYVGNMYEHKNDPHPTIDAKGIETIRVDQCPLTQKIMLKSLKLLFQPPHDIARVRAFVLKQWRKIEQGRIPVQDFIFCKAVKLAPGEYRSNNNPHVQVARRLTSKNPGAKPLFKERIPYLIAHGHADQMYGTKLTELAWSPDDFIESTSLRINEPYYIRHTMMAMKRMMLICGAGLGFGSVHGVHAKFDVALWMKDRSRTKNLSARIRIATRLIRTSSHRTITQYFASNICRLCGGSIANTTGTRAVLCAVCASRPQASMYQLQRHARATRLDHWKTLQVCRACSKCEETPGGREEEGVPCVTTDCSVYYGEKGAQEKSAEARYQVKAALGQLKLKE
jgi:DNA polymerase zeta